MTDPNRYSPSTDVATDATTDVATNTSTDLVGVDPAVVDLAPATPEHSESFLAKARRLGDEVTGRLVVVAGNVGRGIAERAPAVLDRAKEVAGAASRVAGQAWDRRDEVIGPAAELATKAYEGVVKPVGGDVLRAVGEEFGVEHKGKLKVRPLKLVKGLARAARNPVGTALRAKDIALDAAKKSAIRTLT